MRAMARKYTTVTFEGDEAEIKNLIKQCRPKLEFIKFGYVRDDRLVKLATNEVFINEHQESSGHNTESCYRRRVEPIAYDQMANAMVDGHKLIGKKVVAGLDDNDGTIKFSLHNYTIIDLKTGTFDFHYVDLATIIQTLKNIPAMEHVGHGIELMTQYYNPEMHTETWLAKIWWLVDYYNFYNMMDQYSNLLSFSSANI